jgi:hypothetical protein
MSLLKAGNACTSLHRNTAVTVLPSHSLLHFTAIPIIFEGWFQVFQRFFSSKLVLKTVKSRFVALIYYENGSATKFSNSILALETVESCFGPLNYYGIGST